MASYPPLSERPLKNTVALFDVDKTLSMPRKLATPEMLSLLSALRQKCAIGFVGGSDLSKQQEQLGDAAGVDVKTLFDFCFPENGLSAYKLGQPLPSTSFIEWIGETQYKELVRWILRYISDLEDIPVMRGTFVEFRNGMINVSPVGRNATPQERDEFEAWDKRTGTREKMVGELKKRFGHLGLTFSIGGQISFDVFPTGWDKTYCLGQLERDAKTEGGIEYTTIHFFGDKTFKGGNDYEIYEDSRTVGHTVVDPDDTIKQIKEIFDL